VGRSALPAPPLADRVDQLLDDGTDRLHPGLEPLAHALKDTPSPIRTLKWLAEPKVRQLLTDLAAGRVDLDHEALISHPHGPTASAVAGLLVAGNRNAYGYACSASPAGSPTPAAASNFTYPGRRPGLGSSSTRSRRYSRTPHPAERDQSIRWSRAGTGPSTRSPTGPAVARTDAGVRNGSPKMVIQ
jgi:hypothetical protein